MAGRAGMWRQCYGYLRRAQHGLQAQSFALQNISVYIANASTTGYKGIDTTFEDFDSGLHDATSTWCVTAFAQATITTQGTSRALTVGTNMAINGDEFFRCRSRLRWLTRRCSTALPTTDRRGDFQVNANGNLAQRRRLLFDGSCRHLEDPKNPLGNVPQVLQFQNNFIPARPPPFNTPPTFRPSQTQAGSTAATGTITSEGGINPSDFAANPLPIGRRRRSSTPPSPALSSIIT